VRGLRLACQKEPSSRLAEWKSVACRDMGLDEQATGLETEKSKKGVPRCQADYLDAGGSADDAIVISTPVLLDVDKVATTIKGTQNKKELLRHERRDKKRKRQLNNRIIRLHREGSSDVGMNNANVLRECIHTQLAF
jgi:hypothetical protein